MVSVPRLTAASLSSPRACWPGARRVALALALLALAAAACDDDTTARSDVGDGTADLAGDAVEDTAASDTFAPDDTVAPDLGVDTAQDTLAGDTAETSDTGGDDLDPCGRPMPPADRVRKVVVAHPYDGTADGTPHEVFELSVAGELASTGATFFSNRQPFGTIPFTPNGRIGFTVDTNEGTVGVFRFEDDGSVTVVTTNYQDGFYASTVVPDASGEFIYVLDTNWRNNGGGIFRVELACDGTLSNPQQVVPSKLARAMVPMPGAPGQFFLGAADVATSDPAHSAHLVDLATPAYLGGADAFAKTEYSVSTAAVTADGLYGLLADNSAFSGIPNRVGVVSLASGVVSPAGILSPFVDPAGIATSPWNNAALVTAAQEDGIYVLDYDPGNPTAPFSVRGELSYQGGPSLLPDGMVGIARGSLTGLVLVSENTAIRRVRFEQNGGVTDLGPTALADAGGALGMQP